MAGGSLNVGEVVGGAVLGAAFVELFAAIQGAVQTISMFPSLLETLKATCEDIEPVLHDMEKFNEILNRPPEELKRIHDLMKKGKKLVTKCSKVRRFEFYYKWCYAKKLVELDDEMRRFFLINAAAITARNVMELSVDVKEIKKSLAQLSVDVKETEKAMRILAVGQAMITDGGAGN